MKGGAGCAIYWKELKENIVKNQQNERKGSIKSAQYSTSLGNGVMPISAMNASFETLP